MKVKVFRCLCNFFIFAVILFYISLAKAGTYSFEQSGFTGGGVVTGTFFGKDQYDRNGVARPDGFIEACFTHQCNSGLLQDSVSITLTFSKGGGIFEQLNNVLSPVSVRYNVKENFLSFIYDVNSPDSDFLGRYSPDEGRIDLHVNGVGSFEWTTDQPLHVETVPVPAAFWLFAGGLFWILRIARNRDVQIID